MAMVPYYFVCYGDLWESKVKEFEVYEDALDFYRCCVMSAGEDSAIIHAVYDSVLAANLRKEVTA